MDDTIDQSLAIDHQSLAILLQSFESALAANEFARAFELLDLFWARLAMHIRAENVTLFPAILSASTTRSEEGRAPSQDEVRATITALRSDHNFFMDSLAEAIKVLRTLDANDEAGKSERVLAVRDTVARVKERLAEHNKIEEQEVYRWPSIMLESHDLATLTVEVRHHLENLPSRFRESARQAADEVRADH